MEMYLVRRQTVDSALSDSNALEHGDGFLFHPIREGAGEDELLDLGEGTVGVMRDA
jgi:hypothetical protein